MAQELTKENPRTIVKCGKCGSKEVEVRAWVSPNLDNAFSMYYDGSSLEESETCYCRACGEWTSPVFEQEAIPPADPWRCAACGSLSVERKISIDVNSNDFDFGGLNEEFVCSHCECESIIRQSELIRNIDDWFENHLQPDDPEVISGLDYGDFTSEEEYDAACKKLWDARSVEEKIFIWNTLTNRSEE